MLCMFYSVFRNHIVVVDSDDVDDDDDRDLRVYNVNGKMHPNLNIESRLAVGMHPLHCINTTGKD